MRLKTNYMFDINKSLNKREWQLLELEKINKDKYFNKLRSLNIYSYGSYLKSDYWKMLKEKMYLSKTPKNCFCCGSNSYLDIHHRKYKAKDIDRLNISNLVYLCRSCHTKVHKIQKDNKHLTINQATKKLRKLNSF